MDSGGSSDNSDTLIFTREKVVQKYKCNLDQCGHCENWKRCEREPAKQYRKFYRQRSEALKQKFYCEEIGGLCKRACKKYKQCNKKEKTDFNKWKEAYKRGNKDILEQITRREPFGNIISGSNRL